MTEKTIEKLKSLKDKNGNDYIKNGWLDNIDNEIFNKQDENNLSINECIERCTSPTGKDKDEKLKAIFRAFSLFPLSKTQVLILGQDPYTAKSRKADGCAFSVANGKKDASLLNIFKAIKAAYDENKTFDDIKKEDVSTWSCDLKGWATNNHVLLLNAALTHESTVNKVLIQHRNAWEIFVRNTIIKLLTCSSEKLVVFLWGKHAQNLFFRCVESFGINNCDYNSVNKIILGCKNKTNKISREVLCLTTGHPTPNHDVVHKYGFSEDAPCHFKACDEFLGEDIWKNFPENNQ